MAIVAMQALVNQTSFKMRDLQRQTKAIRQTSTQLRLQVADLSVPGKIVREAAKLGLHLPDTRSVHVLQVRQPKAPASPSHEVRAGSFQLNGAIGERP
jgi:cell division protein FtsL